MSDNGAKIDIPAFLQSASIGPTGVGHALIVSKPLLRHRADSINRLV